MYPQIVFVWISVTLAFTFFWKRIQYFLLRYFGILVKLPMVRSFNEIKHGWIGMVRVDRDRDSSAFLSDILVVKNYLNSMVKCNFDNLQDRHFVHKLPIDGWILGFNTIKTHVGISKKNAESGHPEHGLKCRMGYLLRIHVYLENVKFMVFKRYQSVNVSSVSETKHNVYSKEIQNTKYKSESRRVTLKYCLCRFGTRVFNLLLDILLSCFSFLEVELKFKESKTRIFLLYRDHVVSSIPEISESRKIDGVYVIDSICKRLDVSAMKSELARLNERDEILLLKRKGWLYSLRASLVNYELQLKTIPTNPQDVQDSSRLLSLSYMDLSHFWKNLVCTGESEGHSGFHIPIYSKVFLDKLDLSVSEHLFRRYFVKDIQNMDEYLIKCNRCPPEHMLSRIEKIISIGYGDITSHEVLIMEMNLRVFGVDHEGSHLMFGLKNTSVKTVKDSENHNLSFCLTVGRIDVLHDIDTIIHAEDIGYTILLGECVKRVLYVETEFKTRFIRCKILWGLVDKFIQSSILKNIIFIEKVRKSISEKGDDASRLGWIEHLHEYKPILDKTLLLRTSIQKISIEVLLSERDSPSMYVLMIENENLAILDVSLKSNVFCIKLDVGRSIFYNDCAGDTPIGLFDGIVLDLCWKKDENGYIVMGAGVNLGSIIFILRPVFIKLYYQVLGIVNDTVVTFQPNTSTDKKTQDGKSCLDSIRHHLLRIVRHSSATLVDRLVLSPILVICESHGGCGVDTMFYMKFSGIVIFPSTICNRRQLDRCNMMKGLCISSVKQKDVLCVEEMVRQYASGKVEIEGLFCRTDVSDIAIIPLTRFDIDIGDEQDCIDVSVVIRKDAGVNLVLNINLMDMIHLADILRMFNVLAPRLKNAILSTKISDSEPPHGLFYERCNKLMIPILLGESFSISVDIAISKLVLCIPLLDTNEKLFDLCSLEKTYLYTDNIAEDIWDCHSIIFEFTDILMHYTPFNIFSCVVDRVRVNCDVSLKNVVDLPLFYKMYREDLYQRYKHNHVNLDLVSVEKLEFGNVVVLDEEDVKESHLLENSFFESLNHAVQNILNGDKAPWHTDRKDGFVFDIFKGIRNSENEVLFQSMFDHVSEESTIGNLVKAHRTGKSGIYCLPKVWSTYIRSRSIIVNNPYLFQSYKPVKYIIFLRKYIAKSLASSIFSPEIEFLFTPKNPGEHKYPFSRDREINIKFPKIILHVDNFTIGWDDGFLEEKISANYKVMKSLHHERIFREELFWEKALKYLRKKQKNKKITPDQQDCFGQDSQVFKKNKKLSSLYYKFLQNESRIHINGIQKYYKKKKDSRLVTFRLKHLLVSFLNLPCLLSKQDGDFCLSDGFSAYICNLLYDDQSGNRHALKEIGFLKSSWVNVCLESASVHLREEELDIVEIKRLCIEGIVSFLEHGSSGLSDETVKIHSNLNPEEWVYNHTTGNSIHFLHSLGIQLESLKVNFMQPDSLTSIYYWLENVLVLSKRDICKSYMPPHLKPHYNPVLNVMDRLRFLIRGHDSLFLVKNGVNIAIILDNTVSKPDDFQDHAIWVCLFENSRLYQNQKGNGMTSLTFQGGLSVFVSTTHIPFMYQQLFKESGRCFKLWDNNVVKETMSRLCGNPDDFLSDKILLSRMSDVHVEINIEWIESGTADMHVRHDVDNLQIIQKFIPQYHAYLSRPGLFDVRKVVFVSPYNSVKYGFLSYDPFHAFRCNSVNVHISRPQLPECYPDSHSKPLNLVFYYRGIGSFFCRWLRSAYSCKFRKCRIYRSVLLGTGHVPTNKCDLKHLINEIFIKYKFFQTVFRFVDFSGSERQDAECVSDNSYDYTGIMCVVNCVDVLCLLTNNIPDGGGFVLNFLKWNLDTVLLQLLVSQTSSSDILESQVDKSRSKKDHHRENDFDRTVFDTFEDNGKIKRIFSIPGVNQSRISFLNRVSLFNISEKEIKGLSHSGRPKLISEYIAYVEDKISKLSKRSTENIFNIQVFKKINRKILLLNEELQFLRKFCGGCCIGNTSMESSSSSKVGGWIQYCIASQLKLRWNIILRNHLFKMWNRWREQKYASHSEARDNLTELVDEMIGSLIMPKEDGVNCNQHWKSWHDTSKTYQTTISFIEPIINLETLVSQRTQIIRDRHQIPRKTKYSLCLVSERVHLRLSRQECASTKNSKANVHKQKFDRRYRWEFDFSNSEVFIIYKNKWSNRVRYHLKNTKKTERYNAMDILFSCSWPLFAVYEYYSTELSKDRVMNKCQWKVVYENGDILLNRKMCGASDANKDVDDMSSPVCHFQKEGLENSDRCHLFFSSEINIKTDSPTFCVVYDIIFGLLVYSDPSRKNRHGESETFLLEWKSENIMHRIQNMCKRIGSLEQEVVRNNKIFSDSLQSSIERSGTAQDFAFILSEREVAQYVSIYSYIYTLSCFLSECMKWFRDSWKFLVRDRRTSLQNGYIDSDTLVTNAWNEKYMQYCLMQKEVFVVRHTLRWLLKSASVRSLYSLPVQNHRNGFATPPEDKIEVFAAFKFMLSMYRLSWSIVSEDGVLGTEDEKQKNITNVEALFDQVNVVYVNNEDDSKDFVLEIGSIEVHDRSEHAYYDKIVFPVCDDPGTTYKSVPRSDSIAPVEPGFYSVKNNRDGCTSRKDGTFLKKQPHFRCHLKEMASVGGIPVFEKVEINLCSTEFQIKNEVVRNIFKFVFSENTEIHEKNNSVFQKSSYSLVYKPHKGSNTIVDSSYDLRYDGETLDITEMKNRSSKNRSFINILIPSSSHIISYKGKTDGYSIIDIKRTVLKLPDILYRNQTWSWCELLLAVKKSAFKILLSNTGSFVKEKFKLKIRNSMIFRKKTLPNPNK